MKIIKEVLAELPMCYAINIIRIHGRAFCIAASEERQGKIVMIDCQTKERTFVEGLSGGVMNIVPIPEEQGAFLAIQGFYPIFQSGGAQLVKVNIQPNGEPVLQARVQPVLDLPFLHRISLAGSPGRRKVVASTLCAKKDFLDDWSSSGSVYLVDLQAAPDGNAPHCVLLDGIHKNHGMFDRPKAQGRSVIIAGEEGVFEIMLNESLSVITKLMPGGVSDICFYDVDGDGSEEMIAICPFHGDRLEVFRQHEGGWACGAERPMNFGHAVWCGKIEDDVYIVACSRGNKKETVLYKAIPERDGGLSLEEVYVDLDVGASNIVMHQEDSGPALYASNHAKGEVARYFLADH